MATDPTRLNLVAADFTAPKRTMPRRSQFVLRDFIDITGSGENAATKMRMIRRGSDCARVTVAEIDKFADIDELIQICVVQCGATVLMKSFMPVAKRATEHILRLRYCGALTTWGLILVLLVLWRACDAMGWSFFEFCRTQLAYLSLARLLARLETSQECLVRGTR